MNTVVGWLGLLAVFYLTILPHEFAHALAAWSLGFEITKFQIGVPVIVRFKLMTIPVELGPIPLLGLFDLKGEMKDIKVRDRLAIVGAGPLVSIVLGAGILIILYTLLNHLTPAIAKSILSGLKAPDTCSNLGFLSWLIGVLPIWAKIITIGLLFGVVSLAAGLTNLLPLPVLDGGWMFLASIESLTGHYIAVPEWLTKGMLVTITGLGFVWIAYDLWGCYFLG
jgi:membrane-associated protease RseP (regulator of RpoE activity)